MTHGDTPPSSGRQKLHLTRATALQTYLAETRRREPTAQEVEAKIRAARKGARCPTVERAAMDARAVLEWWSEV